MCLSRNGGNLLKTLLKGTPSDAAVKRILEKSKESILDKTRAWRARWDAQNHGAVRKSSKQRKCRVGLVEDSHEERERSLEMYMRLVRVNGMHPVMEAIDEIDPDFVEWGMKRLVEAEDVSTTLKRENIKGIDHLFGGTLEQVNDGDRGCTVAYGRRRVEKPQTPEADKDLSRACKFHDIEGHDVVRWCMVMALVGREMFSKHNGGEVNEMFGPLQTTGQQISPTTFGKVFKELGQSFFGMGNMSVNAMRTVQDTIAVEHGLQL
ncbi:unnamed protein product, partial [Pylaiella littoralis]